EHLCRLLEVGRYEGTTRTRAADIYGGERRASPRVAGSHEPASRYQHAGDRVPRGEVWPAPAAGTVAVRPHRAAAAAAQRGRAQDAGERPDRSALWHAPGRGAAGDAA